MYVRRCSIAKLEVGYCGLTQRRRTIKSNVNDRYLVTTSGPVASLRIHPKPCEHRQSSNLRTGRVSHLQSFAGNFDNHSVYPTNDRRADGALGSDIDRKELILGKLRCRRRHRVEYNSYRPIAATAIHHCGARWQNNRLHCVLYPADPCDRHGRIDSPGELDIDEILSFLPRHGEPRPESLHR